MIEQRFDARRVAALSVVGTLAWQTMTLLPYEVSTLATNYGAGISGAGWIVACELFAVAVSAASMGGSIARRDKRRLTIVGVLLALAASVASIGVSTLPLLIACRVAFGIGSGIVAAATNALPAAHPQPERVFAAMQFAVGLFFGAATYVAGFASEHFGRGYVFTIHLGFLVLFGGASLLLPSAAQKFPTQDSPGNSGAVGFTVGACVVAAALTWAALSAVWAFAEQAGTAAGLDASTITKWLTISGFTTPLGGLAAAALGERGGYARPLLVGFGILMAVALSMYAGRSHGAFIGGMLLLNAPITFVMAYLFGLLASLDHSGRGASIGGAAVNFGGAAGPAMAALVLGAQDLAYVGYLSAAVLAIAVALALSALRVPRKAAEVSLG